ncbi:MAG: PRC and DUF2382 domain-containing protein [Micrococcales bacterium]|nr:PRC and DUF2382 domain-containing protein [Micrococcales bacterium]
MFTVSNVNDLIGADVHDSDDKKVGTVGQIYLDSGTQDPSWVTIKTGLFGTSESFAPLDRADWSGGVLRVPFAKDFVKDAPRVDDDGALSSADEEELYRYYGDHASGSDHHDHAGTDADHADHAHTEGHDTSGPETDDAMTRSEERLRVGTEKVEAGRARLRKHVVTENVTTTVPLSHEEVVVEREPITDANRGAALQGGDLTEEEHEVTLSEERVVTDKETVPVERVRLGTETVTDQEQVSEQVAHEEIDEVETPANGDHREAGRV